jgi:hypothetical protein
LQFLQEARKCLEDGVVRIGIPTRARRSKALKNGIKRFQELAAVKFLYIGVQPSRPMLWDTETKSRRSYVLEMHCHAITAVCSQQRPRREIARAISFTLASLEIEE